MQDTFNRILDVFLGQGLAGAVAILALLGFWKKDRENKALYEAIMEREAKHNEQYQALVREVDITLEAAVAAIKRSER